MDKLIVWMFGINRMNFYGWIFAGIVTLVVTLGLAGLSIAVATDDVQWGILIMLGAIAFILLGILCVLLQIYCTLLAEKLERKGELIREISETPKASDFESAEAKVPSRDLFAQKK